ncbi:uncharacterized protein LOC101845983 [Aplysia californica]|uniref:Uncharacterized protein LOC101845983 n=1 Tax=Aplysia californica TaxID=6500 RepID=A0ABM0KBA0_APLCA|nr:uncharacterized protein LOC101845983 [Aplysia californica]
MSAVRVLLAFLLVLGLTTPSRCEEQIWRSFSRYRRQTSGQGLGPTEEGTSISRTCAYNTGAGGASLTWEVQLAAVKRAVATCVTNQVPYNCTVSSGFSSLFTVTTDQTQATLTWNADRRFLSLSCSQFSVIASWTLVTYSKPTDLTCRSPEITNNDNTVSVTCVSSDIFPQDPRCVLYRQTDGGSRVQTSVPPSYGTDTTGSVSGPSCTFTIQAPELGAGTHSLSVNMYPQFDGSGENYGVNRAVSPDVTFYYPVPEIVNCPSGAKVSGNYIMSGSTATCECRQKTEGFPAGTVVLSQGGSTLGSGTVVSGNINNPGNNNNDQTLTCRSVSSLGQAGPSVSKTVTFASYTNTASLDCDFQTDTCDWTQVKDDQADWRRRRGETNSNGTGPFYDHTYGNFTGVYIYFEGGDVSRANDTASLQSPLLPAQTGAVFSFFYHMKGYQMDTLRVRLVTYDFFGRETSEKILFQKSGKEQTAWAEARIDVDETESFRLFVEALLLHDFGDYTDMAVDDFRFFRTCKSNPCGTDQTCNDRQFGFACAYNCTTAPCLNGGMCGAEGESYTCRCAPGYTGPNCETDIDDCRLLPCQNNAVCIDLVNSYFCACADGFTGTTCEIQLETPECHGLVVDLHATPKTLTPPITAELNITCSLRLATSNEKRVCEDVISFDFGGVASVALTRKGSRDVIEETVSVMSFFENATAKTDHGMLEVEGWLRHVMTSQSPALASLDNRWFYPTDDQAGDYSCTVVAIGSLGRPLTFQVRQKIKVSIPAKQEVRRYVANLHNSSCPK